RGRGAHHLGVYRRSTRFDSGRGRELIVVVRNVNRWDTAGALQRYALAVALERDRDHAELYAELRIRLQALTEIEVENEVEL
ncbi:MAG: hypothetical protein ACRDPW_03675, partial [Mycobacteriales bacterium]